MISNDAENSSYIYIVRSVRLCSFHAARRINRIYDLHNSASNLKGRVKVVKKMRIVDYEASSMKLDLSKVENVPAIMATTAQSGSDQPADNKQDETQSI